MSDMPHRLIEHPVAAVTASAGSALIAEVVSGPLSNFTQACAAATAFVVMLFWLRKFVIQALHDIRDFRRGKLPKVEATDTSK